MTQSVQQQHSVVRTLESLIIRLQKLTKLLAPTEDVPLNLLCSNDTSDLIAQVENALVSIKVEQLHQQAIIQGVWDFFPTPLPVIDKMLSLAQIKPGMKILEPSAGLGHICREVRKGGTKPDCFEISPLLRQGLLLQGFSIIGDDFLSSTPTPIYDLILANPPFFRNGVARHTLHALDWLRPSGRLITGDDRNIAVLCELSAVVTMVESSTTAAQLNPLCRMIPPLHRLATPNSFF